MKKKQGRKTYLKGRKIGSVAAHRPPEKATTSKESKRLGGKFLRNNKMCLSKKGEVFKEVLKAKEVQRN